MSDANEPTAARVSASKRIGLFGGSFDPVHNAHLALARLALDQSRLDQLRWVPTGVAWHKTRQPTPALHRAAMVELAIAGEPRFAIERCELERAGPSYTLDTVRELQQREATAEWVLIIGFDQYASLHRWIGWQELLSRVTLAVAGRPGKRSVAREVAERPCERLDMPLMDVSSTEIRRRIAAGRPIDDLVPAAVAGYIDLHRLYRGRTGS